MLCFAIEIARQSWDGNIFKTTIPLFSTLDRRGLVDLLRRIEMHIQIKRIRSSTESNE